jgi:hypothetical protein
VDCISFFCGQRSSVDMSAFGSKQRPPVLQAEANGIVEIRRHCRHPPTPKMNAVGMMVDL